MFSKIKDYCRKHPESYVVIGIGLLWALVGVLNLLSMRQDYQKKQTYHPVISLPERWHKPETGSRWVDLAIKGGYGTLLEPSGQLDMTVYAHEATLNISQGNKLLEVLTKSVPVFSEVKGYYNFRASYVNEDLRMDFNYKVPEGLDPALGGITVGIVSSEIMFKRAEDQSMPVFRTDTVVVEEEKTQRREQQISIPLFPRAFNNDFKALNSDDPRQREEAVKKFTGLRYPEVKVIMSKILAGETDKGVRRAALNILKSSPQT